MSCKVGDLGSLGVNDNLVRAYCGMGTVLAYSKWSVTNNRDLNLSSGERHFV